MTAVTLPPEVVAECVERLIRIIARANLDAGALNRRISALLNEAQPGRQVGIMRKYADERGRYGSTEVREIVTIMEAAMDPDHVTRLARIRASADAERTRTLQSYREAQHQATVTQSGNVVTGPWNATS